MNCSVVSKLAMKLVIPMAACLSAKANLGADEVKPLCGGRSQKTRSKVGINELLRGI